MSGMKKGFCLWFLYNSLEARTDAWKIEPFFAEHIGKLGAFWGRWWIIEELKLKSTWFGILVCSVERCLIPTFSFSPISALLRLNFGLSMSKHHKNKSRIANTDHVIKREGRVGELKEELQNRGQSVLCTQENLKYFLIKCHLKGASWWEFLLVMFNLRFAMNCSMLEVLISVLACFIGKSRLYRNISGYSRRAKFFVNWKPCTMKMLLAAV